MTDTKAQNRLRKILKECHKTIRRRNREESSNNIHQLSDPGNLVNYNDKFPKPSSSFNGKNYKQANRYTHLCSTSCYNNNTSNNQCTYKKSVKVNYSNDITSINTTKKTDCLTRDNYKRASLDEKTKQYHKNSKQTSKKRPSDHVNIDSKKILETNSYEDISKKMEQRKRHKGNDSTAFDSYNEDLSSYYNEISNPKNNQPKNPLCLYKHKQRINSSPIVKKIKSVDEKEIKDNNSIKKKTKLEIRLQNTIKQFKDRQRRHSPLKNMNNTLPANESDTSAVESMEWEPTDDKILRSSRHEVDPCTELMEWQQDICEVQMPHNESSLYIVVDTNVLIRKISLIEKLSKTTIRGFKVTTVIPWQVLKELDNLKNKVNYTNVSHSARKAILFLAKATNNDCTRVMFQTQAMHFENVPHFTVEIPDDNLIKCCYQFKNQNQKVVLLSNDVNLRVKTNTNNIHTGDDKWISNILSYVSFSKENKTHNFEREPFEEKKSSKDSDYVRKECSVLIHRTTVCFFNFLTDIITIKYKSKYEDLWPLWVPINFNLFEILNFVSSETNFEAYHNAINIIRSFFEKKKSYNDVIPKELEWLGRKIINLARSMTGHFPDDLIEELNKKLKFLKPVGNSITYIEGSIIVATAYFKATEEILNTFVSNFENDLSLKESNDILHHIDLNLEMVEQFRNAILEFQEIQGDIPIASLASRKLHESMSDFVDRQIPKPSFLPIFSPEDIVEFVNRDRTFFVPALSWLRKQENKLNEMKSILV